MIERYSDHAANERTFLAWIRTGIAFVAFGFVLEKFHLLLLRFDIPTSLADPKNGIHDTQNEGLILVGFGLLTLVLSLIRFIHTDQKIRSTIQAPYSLKMPVIIGVIFLLMASFVFFSMMGL